MNMYITEVKDSSNITRLGYSEGNLYITFTSGAEYVYRNVSSDVYTKFAAASSKGSFHSHYIKDKYEFERIN